MKRYIDLAKIRALRKQKGLTQEDMAQALGYMTAIGYHYLETGKRRITAERLALVVITVIMLKSVVAHHIRFRGIAAGYLAPSLTVSTSMLRFLE